MPIERPHHDPGLSYAYAATREAMVLLARQNICPGCGCRTNTYKGWQRCPNAGTKVYPDGHVGVGPAEFRVIRVNALRRWVWSVQREWRRRHWIRGKREDFGLGFWCSRDSGLQLQYRFQRHNPTNAVVRVGHDSQPLLGELGYEEDTRGSHDASGV